MPTTRPTKKNPAVDAYIEKASDFARPILEKLRSAFHKGSPQLEETIKWGVPHFEYKGIVGGMAAFKKHVAFGFWKSKLMDDPEGLFDRGPRASMCSARVEDVNNIPSQKILVDYVRRAVQLNEEGTQLPTQPKRKGPIRVVVPPDLKAALAKSKRAAKAFDALAPSYRRDYVEWLTEAKTEKTRAKRLATAMEWISEGKPRNWKYMPEYR
jgi:uncharacterized protein YdeI (YjbR/CyaY-like superfamily)